MTKCARVCVSLSLSVCVCMCVAGGSSTKEANKHLYRHGAHGVTECRGCDGYQPEARAKLEQTLISYILGKA